VHCVGNSVARMLLCVLLGDVILGLCVVGMSATVLHYSHCLRGLVVCLCYFVFAWWTCLVFCVVDLLLFLSLLCRDGGCGLREMRAGLLQSVCQSSSIVLCSFVLLVVL